LGAVLLGVHGQSDVVSAHGVPEHRGYSIACLPGRRKIVWRLRFENIRTFDSGNALGGDQQEMCASLGIRKNGISISLMRPVGQIHTLAWGGIALLQPVRDAAVLNDLPQGIAILGVTFDREQRRGAEDY
jgi:hypothetical protein